MARQPKRGLDYAPWDVNWMSDPDIDKLADAQGGNGILIYHYLCMRAYELDGYYYEWSYDIAATTARRLGLGIGSETVKQTVDTCFRIGLFDKRLFEEDGVLTSKGIQRRYAEAIQKRSYRTVNRKYWLLDEDETRSLGIICKNFDGKNFLPENADFLPENSNYLPDNCIESKVKESKVKESKVKESKVEEDRNADHLPQPLPELHTQTIDLIIREWNAQQCTHKIKRIPLMDTRYNHTKECIGNDLNGFINTIRSLDQQYFFQKRARDGDPVTYDWFVTPGNYLKITEDNFKDKKGQAQGTGRGGTGNAYIDAINNRISIVDTWI